MREVRMLRAHLKRLAFLLTGFMLLGNCWPAQALEPIYVREHRGLQVLVEPIGRTGDLVVMREIYREKGQNKSSSGDFYAYDCSKHELRYVNLDDSRIMKDAEFYNGKYQIAHQSICLQFNDN